MGLRKAREKAMKFFKNKRNGRMHMMKMTGHTRQLILWEKEGIMLSEGLE